MTNTVAMVARRDGYSAAAAVGSKMLFTELAKVPKAVQLMASDRSGRSQRAQHPVMYSEAIVAGLSGLGIPLVPYEVDAGAFRSHVAACRYPANYAAGPMHQGGAREEKLLEYFVSLDLLRIKPSDIVVDVASEWSLFPEIVRNFYGATVYRQDLVYSPGISGDRIGGNAAHMPVPDGFADKLVLHNAFEHFEGMADAEFIQEAARVLKPGGTLCIVPLDLSDRYSIVTDPLIDSRDVPWDHGAQVVPLPWYHNRFARFYDAEALGRRVLAHARDLCVTIHHLKNVRDIHPLAYLHFALIMQKPQGRAPVHGQNGTGPDR